ncbi:hypothetical protein [Virgibacillus sp. SK37]|uniref:hypothetical protein n=1 Tax=Virgibacillus sp. SK37 TaxID=403957 RepID=UPI0011AA5CBF|nr:hypothetical protein [Virgibacillus sp. SK37]
MALKFPEKVFARMIRVVEKDDVFLFRKDTCIQFGNSSKVLGIVIMTNPGSFSFKDSNEWEKFQNGDTNYKVFEAYDKPDLTMQNIIEVIRKAYENITGVLDGIVQIINVSNIVESKKENVEEKHKKAFEIIQEHSTLTSDYLIDPVINEEYEFIKHCSKLEFIILGFADKVFPAQVSKLTTWSENPAVKGKVVFAKDKIGRLSHPRRWRTERDLSNIAIESLKKVLKKILKVYLRKDTSSFVGMVCTD